MKKIFLTLIVSAFSINLFAHGSIELIECHTADNSKILRGEAEDDSNVFEFKLIEDNKETWKAEDVKIALSDTVDGKKVIENIKFDSNGNSGHFKVHEVYSREIRNGSGTINFKKPKLSLDLSCYAVY